ncbi:hypothetical protein POM88_003906 [Heracleum sosnowskyi]|uniref:ATP-dependent DNA helicase n=1 Tax=Heracleum sosnowskyi TaxID=360622 RepID=A0AAD8JIH2_9APIA|nr:hypothetical protein POM88_003906 [Heracleum sosnowskyi]
MKENVDPFEGINAVPDRILNMMDTTKKINRQNILPRSPHTPLLFDVFNYDLGMMKENLSPNKKKVQVSKTATNKENVDPEDRISAQKLNTPQSGKRQARSRIPKMNRVLNYKKKNMDSIISETPNSTLTSMFNSNVKESSLEQKGFSLNYCKSTVQTLNFDMNTEFAETHRTVDEIDFSRVVGFEGDEPDMFFEDVFEEDTEDLDSWSYDNQQKTEKENKSSRKRGLISQKEFYSYKLQVRLNEGMTPRLGGCLFQQTYLGVMYVVEFQKRGLPHVHMLICLNVSDIFRKSILPVLNLTNQNSHFTSVAIMVNEQLKLNDKQLEFDALAEIHKLLRSIGKSLKDFTQMPQPPRNYLDCGTNNLVMEETSYDISEMESLHKDLISNCNEEQLKVYNSIMNAVEKNEGGLFFVYGSGGCGKTYLWKTLISKLRSESKIVLPVVTSGIAATLLPGGRTTHSRPLNNYPGRSSEVFMQQDRVE